MNILVLDDDTGLLRVLDTLLSGRGHSVTCVEEAEDAIALVADNPYDFVLVDYEMREKSGIWFMENANLPKDTKALLVTANVNRDVICRMFDLGASGYLIKPFDEAELFHQLDYHAKPSL